jgi:hypothetical protein
MHEQRVAATRRTELRNVAGLCAGWKDENALGPVIFAAPFVCVFGTFRLGLGFIVVCVVVVVFINIIERGRIVRGKPSGFCFLLCLAKGCLGRLRLFSSDAGRFSEYPARAATRSAASA